MKIKFSPKSSPNPWSGAVVNDQTARVNGTQYVFSPDIVVYDPSGPILEVYRQDGELYVTVLRTYQGSAPWDTGEYHDISRYTELGGDRIDRRHY